MKRVLCLWLPNWPLQRLVAARPALRYQPIVLHARDSRGGQVVAACSSAARRRGMRVGMPLGEALSLDQSSVPHLEPYDPQADVEALERLAEQCEWFSPVVGVEQDTPLDENRRPLAPECLLLDVTRVGHLFGGELVLARQLVNRFQEQGYLARLALADTIGAAWAVVHGGGTSRSPIFSVPSHQTREALAPLPVAALRLPAATVALLDRLGVETIAQLWRLPRASLSARFGDELLRRWDQARGAIEEVVVARRPPVQFSAEWLLEHATDRRDSIDFVLSQLVDRVACLLASRGEGVVRLECGLETAGREATGEAVGNALRMRIDLFRPTADARHLMDLVRMQLETLTLRGPVERACVEAILTARLEPRQMDLFADQVRGASRQLNVLIDRLSARLGRQAVVRPRLQADAQPELAHYDLPLAGEPSRSRAARKSTRPKLGPAERPLRLEPKPLSLQVIAIAPDGPPARFTYRGRTRRVVRHWGPERIETGWWRGQTIRRDYYRVETETGQRLWLFRRLQDGQWFLHGQFE